jgi:glycine/D-amino acid oxidase-like deaminating enzyme
VSPQRSLWLREALSGEEQEPPLEGQLSTDVAVVGGGYVGLWTAIRIKEAAADCDVVLLERDVCGGGASGRNGGFVLSWWPKVESLVSVCGEAEGLRIARAAERAVDELGNFCQQHGIDAHYRRGDHLWTATSPAQQGAWSDVLAFCERLGVRAFEPLEPREVARRTGSPVHLGGVREPVAATVHPGLLVRGLRRVALAHGVRIHEDASPEAASSLPGRLGYTARPCNSRAGRARDKRVGGSGAGAPPQARGHLERHHRH